VSSTAVVGAAMFAGVLMVTSGELQKTAAMRMPRGEVVDPRAESDAAAALAHVAASVAPTAGAARRSPT
jgi:hypothetical protein